MRDDYRILFFFQIYHNKAYHHRFPWSIIYISQSNNSSCTAPNGAIDSFVYAPVNKKTLNSI